MTDMTNDQESSYKTISSFGEKEIKEKVLDAQITLERINSWINNCDMKTATVLSFIGIILTIILTNNGIVAIINNIEKMHCSNKFIYILLLTFGFISIAMLVYGFFKLICVIWASVNIKKYRQQELTTDSLIFFGSIAKKSSFKEYKNMYYQITNIEKLNDLLSQVYINSCIAEQKYSNYNKGLTFSIIGIFAIGILFVIGLNI